MAVVVLTSGARDQAKDLPNPIRHRVHKLFKRLENWPVVSGAKPLQGELSGKYRLRTGDYRVQFRVDRIKSEEEDDAEPDFLIVVEKIGHRDGFYED